MARKSSAKQAKQPLAEVLLSFAAKEKAFRALAMLFRKLADRSHIKFRAPGKDRAWMRQVIRSLEESAREDDLIQAQLCDALGDLANNMSDLSESLGL